MKSDNPGLVGKNKNPVRCALLLLLKQQTVEGKESGLIAKLLRTSENSSQGMAEIQGAC